MITINDFNEIIKLDTSLPTYDYDLVGIILSIPAEEMGEMPINEFIKNLNKVKNYIQVRKINENEVWNNINVGYKNDFMSLTFGEYVDLESYLNNKKFNEFLKIIYKTDIDFNDAPLPILFYKIDEFELFIKKIHENYSSIFSVIDEEENNEDEEERFISPKRTAINTKEQQMAAKQKKWGWYSVAFSLAKNDITKLDEVFNQPLIKVLNILSMVRELSIDLNPNSYPLYT